MLAEMRSRVHALLFSAVQYTVGTEINIPAGTGFGTWLNQIKGAQPGDVFTFEAGSRVSFPCAWNYLSLV